MRAAKAEMGLTGVRGEVVVTQRAEPEDNTPITVAET